MIKTLFSVCLLVIKHRHIFKRKFSKEWFLMYFTFFSIFSARWIVFLWRHWFCIFSLMVCVNGFCFLELWQGNNQGHNDWSQSIHLWHLFRPFCWMQQKIALCPCFYVYGKTYVHMFGIINVIYHILRPFFTRLFSLILANFWRFLAKPKKGLYKKTSLGDRIFALFIAYLGHILWPLDCIFPW